jgi:hypothetical protein
MGTVTIPPRKPSVRRPRSASKRSDQKKTGRPSHEDYVRRVWIALRLEPLQLEECTALAQLPGVQARIRERPLAFLPTATALRALLDEAVGEVERMVASSEDATSQRIVAFLRIWYRERGTVTQVAHALSLSRSHVAHGVQRRALELVTRRFLDAAWQVLQSA